MLHTLLLAQGTESSASMTCACAAARSAPTARTRTWTRTTAGVGCRSRWARTEWASATSGRRRGSTAGGEYGLGCACVLEWVLYRGSSFHYLLWRVWVQSTCHAIRTNDTGVGLRFHVIRQLQRWSVLHGPQHGPFQQHWHCRGTSSTDVVANQHEGLAAMLDACCRLSQYRSVACYSHKWCPSRTKLMAVGGPITVGVDGCCLVVCE